MRRIIILSLCLISIRVYAKQEVLVPFSFEKRKLADIVDDLKSIKKIDVIPPQQAAAAQAFQNQLITYLPYGRTSVPITEAWRLLTLFLELSGFSIVPKKTGMYALVPIGKPDEAGASRETLPFYVDVPPDKLPHSEERIRYLYNMRNIKVPTRDEQDRHPFSKIFKEMLSPGAPVIYDQKNNAFIVVDTANTVASLINLISQLDATGFTESINVIPIHTMRAQDIANVFESIKKAAGDAETSTRASGQQTIAHFAADTTILADNRTNTLILMGRENNIERISDFIHEHIDVTIESGKSILHTYNLQYLDAQTFAPVLQKLVSYSDTETQATQAPQGGPARFFKGVQVIAENIIEIKDLSRTEEVTLEQTKVAQEIKGVEGVIRAGGNRLIIAALQEDWTVIREFLQKVDQPQPQVILEVVIADFSYNNRSLIRSTVRSKTDFGPSDKGVQFLASHITPVNRVLGSSPTQLAQDLLRIIGPTGVTPVIEQGSLLLSFNDPQTPGIFGLLQVLKRVLNVKLTSHPYLITSNNQKGMVESQEIRRFRGDLVTTTNGTFTVPIEDVTATLTVNIVPHIASDERVRLDIGLNIIDFIDRSTLTRITRELRTTATLSTGQILAIGGLTRVDRRDFATVTPLLGSIPIIGQFFRGDSHEKAKVSIGLFVSPIIIQPRFNLAGTSFTKDKIAVVKQDTDDSFIDNTPKDPITHIFFRRKAAHATIEHYLDDTDNLSKKALQAQIPVKYIFPTEPPDPETGKFEKLKELLACEDTSFLSLKHTQSQSILNS